VEVVKQQIVQTAKTHNVVLGGSPKEGTQKPIMFQMVGQPISDVAVEIA
jgi:hypothetical protein